MESDARPSTLHESNLSITTTNTKAKIAAHLAQFGNVVPLHVRIALHNMLLDDLDQLGVAVALVAGLAGRRRAALVALARTRGHGRLARARVAIAAQTTAAAGAGSGTARDDATAAAIGRGGGGGRRRGGAHWRAR